MEFRLWRKVTLLIISIQVLVILALALHYSSFGSTTYTLSTKRVQLREGQEWVAAKGESDEHYDSDVGSRNYEFGDEFFHLSSSASPTSSLVRGGCFTPGTQNSSGGQCACRSGWFGANCSLPELVYNASSPRHILHGVTFRSTPRRVIVAFQFHLEYHLTEARLDELYPVVDVFVIGESNYTVHGDSKPMSLLVRLQHGYLRQYQDKILHVATPQFPDGGRRDRWLAEHHAVTALSQRGISRLLNTRHDDVFLLTDGDEIPRAEAITFLRYHDSYPEPVAFNYRFSSYGFYWRHDREMRALTAACSLHMLRYLYDGDAYELRNGGKQVAQYMRQIRRYQRLYEKRVYRWTMGDSRAGRPAGWHCSWCLPAEGVRTKLGQHSGDADFPRLGGRVVEKLGNVAHIRSLIREGMYFDGRHLQVSAVNVTDDEMSAPRYFTDTRRRDPEYRYLVENIYKEKNLTTE